VHSFGGFGRDLAVTGINGKTGVNFQNGVDELPVMAKSLPRTPKIGT
jgi:hypothetical protein